MTHDPTRDEFDGGDELAHRLDEVPSGELGDVEVIDADQPQVPRLMANTGPAAPDPADIAARLANADFDALLGSDEPEAAPVARSSGSLADRLSFDNVPKPKPTPRARRMPVETPPSLVGRIFGKLFGRRS